MLVADTHVHIYPNYSIKNFLDNCFNKISIIRKSFDREVVMAICLTETIDCNYYVTLTKNKLPSGYSIEEFEKFKVINCDQISLFIFPGFQINTKERIEVLELFTNERTDSQLSLDETLSKISTKQALPIVSWSFGKWIGRRGELIRKCVLSKKYNFCLGDSALRFNYHPKPKLFNLAQKNNLRIMYGSDPLPLNGEEMSVFDYYSIFEDFAIQDLNTDEIGELIKKTICLNEGKSCGRRNDFLKFLFRWLGVMFQKS